MTEGACATYEFLIKIIVPRSPSPDSVGSSLPEGAFLFTYDLSISLTSTAYVATNAKYGILLSRYTIFLKNCPLEYDSKAISFVFGRGRRIRSRRDTAKPSF